MNNIVNDNLNNSLAEVLPGAMHYNFAFPWDKPGIHLVSGNGHFVNDTDGNTYIDFFSKFGASFLGHNNKRYTQHIADSVQASLTAIDHFGEDEYRIVAKLLAAIPGAEQVRFSLSGTEAVQNAFRAARTYTDKDKIIRFTGHYHGSADNVLGGTSSEPTYIVSELANDTRGTAGRASDAFNATLLLPWNDQQALDSVLTSRDDIAAIIMEPVCINGGGIEASPDYFQYLKAASKKHDFLIIFDEIITGFRLGYGSTQKRIGIVPDIWIFGKAIGGGSLPVSCFMASTEIMNQYSTKRTSHGGTFNGYPLGLHAIDITLDILGKSDIYQTTRDAAEHLRQLLLDAASANGVDLVIQGDLLAMCLHATDKNICTLNEWTPEMKDKEAIIRQSLADQCILIAPPCRIYPTLALSASVITAVKEKVDAVFKDVKDHYTERGYAR